MRSITVLTFAIGLLAAPALGSTNLVVNGGFDSAVTAKSTFAGNVAGWSGGNLLTFIDPPGTADNGVYLSVYGPFPATSPAGGKFVEADGDPNWSSTISQTIDGLTVGASYTLRFYQAAGQQLGARGGTTERWSVSFGDDTRLSHRYVLGHGQIGPWVRQEMVFTAHSASQLLSFLAVGTPRGAPPISFLDGVSLGATVPEPATWALLLAGFGLVGVARRRRAALLAGA